MESNENPVKNPRFKCFPWIESIQVFSKDQNIFHVICNSITNYKITHIFFKVQHSFQFYSNHHINI